MYCPETRTYTSINSNYSPALKASLQRWLHADDFCTRVREFLRSGTLPMNATLARTISEKSKAWFVKDNVLWIRRTHPIRTVQLAVVVPLNLRFELLKQAHSSTCSGHRGYFGTFHRLALRHYWPSMQADVTRFCRECVVCQKTKTSPHFKAHSLQPWPVPKQHGERCHLDLCGPILGSDNQPKYILVCTDAFSKWVELSIIPNKSAITVARAFFSSWLVRHSAPKLLISDAGPEFVNKIFEELSTSYGIQRETSAAMHHLTNGQVERYNRTLHSFITAITQECPLEWEYLIPAVQLGTNTVPSHSSKFAPWTVLYGREPKMPWFEICSPESTHDTVDEESYVRKLANVISKTCKFIEANNNTARTKMKEHYDKTPREDRSFKAGDEVLIHFPRESFKGARRKWQVSWQGPFVISRRANVTTYFVSRNGKERKLPVHVNRLKKFIQPSYVLNRSRSTPADTSSDETHRPPTPLSRPTSSSSSSTESAQPTTDEESFVTPHSQSNNSTLFSSSSSNQASDDDDETDDVFQAEQPVTQPSAEFSPRQTRSRGPVEVIPLPNKPPEYRQRRQQ